MELLFELLFEFPLFEFPLFEFPLLQLTLLFELPLELLFELPLVLPLPFDCLRSKLTVERAMGATASTPQFGESFSQSARARRINSSSLGSTGYATLSVSKLKEEVWGKKELLPLQRRAGPQQRGQEKRVLVESTS